MSEEALAGVPAEVSNEQVEAFFEAGGEVETPEVTPEVEAKSEPAVEAPKDEPKQEKVVPYGALHEERMKRKELQEKVTKMEQTFQQFQERLKQPEPQIPAFEEDPLSHLKAQQEQFEAWKRQQDQMTVQQQAYAKQQEEANKVISQYRALANEYKSQTPDFDAAYTHLRQSRYDEYVAAGYPPEQAQSFVIEDEFQIAAKAIQDGVNPGERLYALAKVRGYQRPVDKPAEPNAAEKMEALARGQAAAKSLSGGGTGKAELSLEALAEMSGDEFDKAWEKLVGPSR